MGTIGEVSQFPMKWKSKYKVWKVWKFQSKKSQINIALNNSYNKSILNVEHAILLEVIEYNLICCMVLQTKSLYKFPLPSQRKGKNLVIRISLAFYL